MHGPSSEKPNNSSSIHTLLVIGLILLVGGMGWGYKVLKGDLLRVEERISALETLLDETTSVEVNLFFQKQTPTDFFLAPEKRRISRRGSFYENVLRGLAKGPLGEDDLTPTLPKDVEVRGVEVRGDIALVDLGNIVDKLNVGALGEAIVIFSIVNTMAQFPEIKRVQILIDGQRIESLAGHMSIYDPLEADWTLVRW